VEALGESCTWSGGRCGPLCSLARIALAEGDLAQAQSYTAEILHSLDAFEGTGFVFGLTAYSVCYQVLHASENRRAWEVLEEIYRLLCARAEVIDDPALHRSYLENVDANREIATAWEEHHRD
jgi:predicted component of type VI protein secretion system